MNETTQSTIQNTVQNTVQSNISAVESDLTEWNKLQSTLHSLEGLTKEHPQFFTKPLRIFSQLDTRTQFLSLPSEFQQKAVQAFNFYVETLHSMVINNESPTNSKLFLWRAFQKLKLVPLDNQLFEHITGDDIIEVYSSEGIQVFRSFSFLEPISYAIEDLIVFPWNNLFEREAATTAHLIDQAIRLFKQEISGTQLNEIDYEHDIREAKSPDKNVLRARFGIVSPVISRDPSNISYFATTFKRFDPLMCGEVFPQNPQPAL